MNKEEKQKVIKNLSNYLGYCVGDLGGVDYWSLKRHLNWATQELDKLMDQ